ncbi:MAG: FHA domain-containing protein [Verrucomicrobiae bacterium]|nr:FHA domain-containing protein [Verrucomicrobiae bacterium]MCB1091161.1 FHA domain-containing protein [Verrucomicrobiae bacterium]
MSLLFRSTVSQSVRVVIEPLPTLDGVEPRPYSVMPKRFPFRFGRLEDFARVSHRWLPEILQVDDPQPHNVSREHCELSERSGKVWVRDLDSRLGAQVNGRHIGRNFPSFSAQLHEGENELILGRSHRGPRFRITVTRLD